MRASMRTLVFGGTGMLGRAVAAEARRRGWPALALGHAAGRRHRRRRRCAAGCASFAPQLVVNCAAFTEVDDCESRRERAFAVNGDGGRARSPPRPRDGRRAAGARLDRLRLRRRRARALPEDARDRAALGLRRLEARAASAQALALRRARWWCAPAGCSAPAAPNFVATMRAPDRRGAEPLRVVDDQVGCPTYTPFLAARAVRPRERGRRAARALPQPRAGLLARLRRARSPPAAAPAAPRSPPVTTARVPAPGAAPGLLGARRRPLRGAASAAASSPGAAGSPST